MKKAVFLILIIGILLYSGEMASQCAMCRAVLESEGDTSKAEGINRGIVYLMAFPYILVGIFGYLIYRNRQRDLKKSK
ncbi:MAG TPA: hypothetical protein VKZ42_06110 [Flavobacteriaceae bacterium]|nr:hypothetical protein [Flavobacteriaceae bacterium]